MKRKIRILIDFQIFTIQTFGGISRIYAEVYKRYIKNSNVDCKIPIVFSENEYFKDVFKVHSFLKGNTSFFKKLFYYIINRIYCTFGLIKGDFDIFQPTYYDPYFLPFLKGKPFVLVVLDMTHEIFPESVSLKDRTIEWKKKLVHKAARIIAISENTKRDIIKFYGIDEDKIDVVYLGTSITVPKRKVDIELPKEYILFLGNRGKYKNYNTFFKAVVPILKEKESLYLVCAGSSSFSKEEINMFNSFGLKERVKHIRFRDEDMGYIYNRALCFVFPSLYEGFGIPVLEAFACDCPAIISNTSSFPEVGGNAVVYFNPKDIESIQNSVKKVIEEGKLREDLIKKGRERLKMFSWEKCEENMLTSYRRVLKEFNNR